MIDSPPPRLQIIRFFMAATLALASFHSFADDCEDFLKYSHEERVDIVFESLYNASPTRKATIAILLESGCRERLSDFPRSEANKDVAKFLPNLRAKYGKR